MGRRIREDPSRGVPLGGEGAQDRDTELGATPPSPGTLLRSLSPEPIWGVGQNSPIFYRRWRERKLREAKGASHSQLAPGPEAGLPSAWVRRLLDSLSTGSGCVSRSWSRRAQADLEQPSVSAQSPPLRDQGQSLTSHLLLVSFQTVSDMLRGRAPTPAHVCGAAVPRWPSASSEGRGKGHVQRGWAETQTDRDPEASDPPGGALETRSEQEQRAEGDRDDC